MALKTRIKNKIRREIKKMPFDSKKRKVLVSIYKEMLYASVTDKSFEISNTMIKRYLGEKELSKKERKNIIKEMLYYRNMYLTTLSEYFMFSFDKISEEESTKYITNGMGKYYLRYLNTDTAKITANKYNTYKMYKEFYKREMIFCKSEDDFDNFKEYCKKHTKFVKKPHSAECGKGVELIDTTGKKLKELFNQLLEENEKFILEELIEQEEKMASLHPGSVNCVRIYVLIKDDGTMVVDHPFLKVGQNNSFVDNGGAGGILALIDSKTGKILSNGMDEDRNEYLKHPNTNVKFKGFQIPKWNELVKMMMKVAKISPNGRYLGWDVALSKKGWMIVEGNSMTAFIGQQMPIKKGMKKEFEEMINWKDVPNKEQYKTSKKKKIS